VPILPRLIARRLDKVSLRLTGHPQRDPIKSEPLPRKEVIQPQLPLRLPCYDFVPITSPALDGCLRTSPVGPPASGVAGFRDVTGGVYKAREHIHRGNADPRLLATPASRGRVAAPDPNWDRVWGIRSALRLGDPLSRPL
jgi:hypothetical protein